VASHNHERHAIQLVFFLKFALLYKVPVKYKYKQQRLGCQGRHEALSMPWELG